MSNPIPSQLALTNIADGSPQQAAPIRNNYSAIQAAVNDLIVAFGVTAKGDLVVATASGQVQVVSVGANGTVLTADSTQTAGVKWVAPTPGSVRPITGQINADGSIAAGSGFTVAKGGTGTYTVTFTTAFAAVPTVVATVGPFATAGIIQAAVVTAVSTTAVSFNTLNGSNVVDRPFIFVAHTTA